MSIYTCSQCLAREKEEKEQNKVNNSFVESHGFESCAFMPISRRYSHRKPPSPPQPSCAESGCLNCCPVTKRTKKPQTIEISSMTGIQLRSVISSQIKVQNLLRESIAQLTEYADKVLHEDFSARPFFEKEVFEKIKCFFNLRDDASKLESKPNREPRGKEKIDPIIDIMPEFYKKPKKESQMKLKKKQKNDRKIQLKSELKVEPKIHSTKEKTNKETSKKAKHAKQREPKWESNGIINKETKCELKEKESNGIIKEEAKGESKEKESEAKQEKKMKSIKSLNQRDVENQIHSKVVSPIINRIQRSYLTSMEDQMRLMTYLESLPSTLANLLKD